MRKPASLPKLDIYQQPRESHGIGSLGSFAGSSCSRGQYLARLFSENDQSCITYGSGTL